MDATFSRALVIFFLLTLQPTLSFHIQRCIHDLTNNKTLILSFFWCNYFTRIICKGFMLVCSSHILFAASIGTGVSLWFCLRLLCISFTDSHSFIRKASTIEVRCSTKSFTYYSQHRVAVAELLQAKINCT